MVEMAVIEATLRSPQSGLSHCMSFFATQKNGLCGFDYRFKEKQKPECVTANDKLRVLLLVEMAVIETASENRSV